MTRADKDKLMRTVQIKHNSKVQKGVVVDVLGDIIKVFTDPGDGVPRAFLISKSCIESYGPKIEGTMEELLTSNSFYYRSIGQHLYKHVMDNDNA